MIFFFRPRNVLADEKTQTYDMIFPFFWQIFCGRFFKNLISQITKCLQSNLSEFLQAICFSICLIHHERSARSCKIDFWSVFKRFVYFSDKIPSVGWNFFLNGHFTNFAESVFKVFEYSCADERSKTSKRC